MAKAQDRTKPAHSGSSRISRFELLQCLIQPHSNTAKMKMTKLKVDPRNHRPALGPDEEGRRPLWKHWPPSLIGKPKRRLPTSWLCKIRRHHKPATKQRCRASIHSPRSRQYSRRDRRGDQLGHARSRQQKTQCDQRDLLHLPIGRYYTRLTATPWSSAFGTIRALRGKLNCRTFRAEFLPQQLHPLL